MKHRKRIYSALSLVILVLLAFPAWAATIDWTKVDGGELHTIALKSDGTVWAWGGDGTTINSIPIQVSGLTNVTAISAGAYYSVALRSDGTVWVWNSNPNDTPNQVSGLTAVKAIVAGAYHTIALKNDGTVWTWGDNGAGQLGDGTTTDRSTPGQVSGLTGITAIAGGAWYTMALKSDGTIWAWGDNRNGQLGDGSTTWRYAPVQISGISNVTAISLGYYHTIALKSDGTVWTWGRNSEGQLGNGTTTESHSPVQVTGLTGITAIADGAYHSDAIKNDGTVWAWGQNATQVSGISNATSIGAGWAFSAAIKSDGTLWTWGKNDKGQLGDCSTINRYSPTQIKDACSNVTSLMGGSVQGNPLNFTDTNAVVTTIAGSALLTGSTDGTGASARFYEPVGITTDGTNLFVSDYKNHTIRKMAIDTGAVTTIAGSAGFIGSTDGTGTSARFNYPRGITTDGTNLFETDYWGHTIRKIVISTGEVTTLAGSAGNSGSTDGTGAAARFNNPNQITTDGTNLFIADTSNHTIRKVVMSTGVVTTLVGLAGNTGSTDGTGTAARFNWPDGITTDGTNLFVTETVNHTIRKVVISTGVVTTIAGSAGISGSTDGTGAAARFNSPRFITTDGTNLFVAEHDNHTIRKIVISTGAVTTIAGSAGITGSTDGTGTSARFNTPYGITTDGTNLFITDVFNHTIRKISPDTTSPTGSISINSGASYTNATSATLALSCTDTNGCSQMQFSNDNTNWSIAETYTTSKAWTLSTGDGTKTVYVKFKDLAGNWSSAFSDTILLDTTAPATAASPAGGTYTSAQSVTLSCSDGTGSGCNKGYYTTDGTTPTASSTIYSGPISISKDTTLKFFAVDNAGNAGTVKTETYVITAINAVDTAPPANPSNLDSTSNSDGSITLSWTAPTDADLSGYNVYRDGVKINSNLVKTNIYKDSNTTNGATYTYKVTSVDLAGNESSGVTKTAIAAVQANTPPSAPVNVKVEDIGTGYSLKVIWPANTESDLAGYKVYWGTASGTYANSQNAGNTTSDTITGLTEGAKYYIAVTAYDADGNDSAKSIEATGTPKAIASRPNAPTGLTVMPGNKYLTLSWTGISNVTGYMVYIGEANGVYGTPVRTTNTTHTFQNLENNKTYYVAVSSYDLNSGSRYTVSSESERTSSSGTPYDNEAPAAPSNTTATDAGTGGSIALKWDREESFDIAGYVVAYKKTGNSVFEGITSTGVTWNYAVTGLTNGSSYAFNVYAYDSNGNFSDPSSTSATPTISGSTADVTPPGIPTLSAAPGNGKVTLMITPPSDTDIDHYNLYVYNLAAGKYMPLTSINGLSYEHSTGVDNGKALVFVATAVDAAGNESGYSTTASAVPSELPGDIPLEDDPPVLDRVDGYDVNEIAKGFGSNIGKANYNANSDLDGDGKVDGNDLLILGTNHGKSK